VRIGNLWPALPLAGVLAMTAACTNQEGGGARPDAASRAVVSPPAAVATPDRLAVDKLSLPADAYKPTPAQRIVIDRAAVLLTNDCMKRFGFDAVLPPPQEPDQPSLARRYGITDATVARTYGYHLAPGDGIRVDKKPQGGPSLSDSELLVLTGNEGGKPGTPAKSQAYNGAQIPAGGCTGEASAKLGFTEAFGTGTTLADEIDLAAFSQAQADSRVTDVFKRWSACMRDRGYTFDTPFDPAGKADLQAPVPSRSETETALADVQCKKETNLVGVFHGVEVAYAQAAIDKNAEALDQLKRDYLAALTKAAQALGVSAPS
jgi:hypothetical protein